MNRLTMILMSSAAVNASGENADANCAVAFVAAYAAVQQDWTTFRQMRPRPLGKVTTFAQFALILIALIWPALVPIAIAGTIGVSVLATGDYLVQFTRVLRERPQPRIEAPSKSR